MRSTFAGIEIARRALAAQQTALNVTAHNIANANAPGYTRQSAVMRATPPYPAPASELPHGAGQLGTGVEVAVIRRMGDEFIQAEIAKEARNTGYWNTRRQILRQIEVALMEPSDTGVNAAFERYWKALQELHKTPESMAVRAVVIEEANVLAQTLRHVRSQLVPIQRSLDQELRRNAEQLTILGEQIAALNRQIAHAQVMGYQPNDLLDQRDQLVTEVSRLAGATVAEREQGMIAVIVGGVALVDGAQARRIEVQADPGRPGLSRFVWEGLGTDVQFSGGEMLSQLEGRDQLVPEQIRKLDLLAATLIAETNAIHRAGYGLDGSTGHAFFVGADASDIAVNPNVAAHLERIAASRTGDPGDGSVALELADLCRKPVMEGNATFATYFSGVVSRVGVLSQKAQQMAEFQADVENHLNALRESVAGVNLDEEMTNMVMYQHAYAAAARVVNAMDEALDVLINRMGLVGR